MSVTEIKYTLSENGITPSTIQDGGIQGDHNAKSVIFTFEKSFYEKIKDKSYTYYFDLYNGEGSNAKTESQKLLSDTVSYSIEEWLSRFGGKIAVQLVITETINETTTQEIYCYPAKFYLKNRPLNNENGAIKNHEQTAGTLLKFAKVAKDSAENAKVSAESAKKSEDETKNAAVAFGKDVEWIFSGGNATSNVGINFVVENTVDTDNAVSGTAVKKFVKQTKDELEEYVNSKTEVFNPVNYIVVSEDISGDEEDPFPNYYYELYENDIIELWGRSKPYEINFENQYGALFYKESEFYFLENFFDGAPYWVDIKAISGSGLIFSSIRSVTDKVISCYIVNSIKEEQTVTFMIRARGKWGGYVKPTTEV